MSSPDLDSLIQNFQSNHANFGRWIRAAYTTHPEEQRPSWTERFGRVFHRTTTSPTPALYELSDTLYETCSHLYGLMEMVHRTARAPLTPDQYETFRASYRAKVKLVEVSVDGASPILKEFRTRSLPDDLREISGHIQRFYTEGVPGYLRTLDQVKQQIVATSPIPGARRQEWHTIASYAIHVAVGLLVGYAVEHFIHRNKESTELPVAKKFDRTSPGKDPGGQYPRLNRIIHTFPATVVVGLALLYGSSHGIEHFGKARQEIRQEQIKVLQQRITEADQRIQILCARTAQDSAFQQELEERTSEFDELLTQVKALGAP